MFAFVTLPSYLLYNFLNLSVLVGVKLIKWRYSGKATIKEESRPKALKMHDCLK